MGTAFALWLIAILPPPPPAEKPPAGPAEAPPKDNPPTGPKTPVVAAADAARRRAEDEKALRDAGKALETILTAEKEGVRRGDAIRSFARAVQKLDPFLLQHRAIPVLRRLYQENNPDMRAAVLEAVSMMDVPDAVPWISDEMRASADPLVRAAAARILGARRDPKTLPVLHEKLSDPDPGVQRDVLRALAEIRDLSSVPPIVNLAMPSIGRKKNHAEAGSAKQATYQGLMRETVASLVAITGEDFGENQDEWQRWWNTKGRVLYERSRDRPPPTPVPDKPPAIPGKPPAPDETKTPGPPR